MQGVRKGGAKYGPPKAVPIGDPGHPPSIKLLRN